MASIAILLQENVIEDLDMSYLIRRRSRPSRPKKEEQKESEQQTEQDDDKVDETEETPPATENNEGDGDGEGDEKEEDDYSKAVTDTGTNDDEEEQPASKKSEDDDQQQQGQQQQQQQVRNTSLKRLLMAGNGLDDEYLESLLGIFAPNKKSSTSTSSTMQQPEYSRLEELTLFGNRFSNHGIQKLLKALPHFPYLQRLYLGHQQTPPAPAASMMTMLSASATTYTSTLFCPGSLKDEFVKAIVDTPNNCRLMELDISTTLSAAKKNNDDTTTTAEIETETTLLDLRRILKYYTRLNAGGRRILASYVDLNDGGDAGGSDDQSIKLTSTSTTSSATSNKTVPLGLWPLVLERANRLYPLSSPSSSSSSTAISGNNSSSSDSSGDATATNEESKKEDSFHAGDVLFCLLLHGPMVL